MDTSDSFEPDSLDVSRFSEHNVSNDPINGSTPRSKFNTEDFLRHETNVPRSDILLADEGPSVKTPSSQVADKESNSFPSPLSNDVEGQSNEIGQTNGSSSVEDNSEVCSIKHPIDSGEDGSTNMPNGVEITDSSELIDFPGSSINKESDEPTTSKSSSSDPKSPDSIEDVTTPEQDEWMDILGSGHLMKKIIKAGEPDTRPNKSDICTLSFTGRLEDGTVVEEVENIRIHLNDNEVIQGIDFALALMEKGEEAELKVGPRFAYGSLGWKPKVPSGATLYYTVKLLDVQEDPPINTLPISERMSLGLQKKERGNWWYSRDEHSIAINCYRRALEFLDDTDVSEPQQEDEIHKLVEERLKTYNNLTASQMKIHAYDAALMSVNYVLTSQPQNVKALFRKCKILREKGDIQEAIKVVRLGLSFNKDSQTLQQELSSLLAAQRKDNSKQRELYKKMMGTSGNQEKEEKNRSSRSTYSTIKWTSILAFAAVLVAGTVALKYKM